MSAPLLSIVLCFRNPGPRLATTLRSLAEQTEASWELILVDGASTDGSVGRIPEVLRPRLTLISEPDRGVYDAMNKALLVARGEWVYFLGADDRLADTRVLEQAAGPLRKSRAMLLSGLARYEDGRVYGGRAGRPIARNFLHHQATFYRRQLFERLGSFDPELRMQADYDFNLRALKPAGLPETTDLLVAECGCGGLSDAGAWENYREEILVRHRHFPAWAAFFWDLASVLRYLRKRLLRKLRNRPE